MRGINQVFLMGHLGHDPEARETAGGKPVCDIRIATNRSIRTHEGWNQSTDWHRIRLWERHVELAIRYLRKGHPLAIQGNLRNDTWTDKDGQQRSRTIIHCDKLHLVRAPRSMQDTTPTKEDEAGLQQDVNGLPPDLAPRTEGS